MGLVGPLRDFGVRGLDGVDRVRFNMVGAQAWMVMFVRSFDA
jgi:hypothetical protein